MITKEKSEADIYIYTTALGGTIMPKQSIELTMNIDNIGPHNGPDKIHFPCQMDSNKMIIYAPNGAGKSFISRLFRLTSPEKLSMSADDLITLDQSSGSFSLSVRNSEKERRLSISIHRGVPVVVNNDTGYIFHVFNSDFIEENIKPRNYTPDGNIEGYITGRIQIELSTEKEREAEIREAITRMDYEIKNYLETAKSELRDKGVQTSTKEYGLFNEEDLREIEMPTELLEYEVILEQLKSLGQLPDKPDISEPYIKGNTEIINKAAALLTATYPGTGLDDEFITKIKENRAFIEKGVEMLKDNESVCPFCLQSIGVAELSLIHKYKAFLANKESQFLREIDDCIADVDRTAINISRYIQEMLKTQKEIEDLKKYLPSLQNKSIILTIGEEEINASFQALRELLKNKKRNTESAESSVKEVAVRCRSVIDSILQQHKNNASIIQFANDLKNNTNHERLELRRSLCRAQLLRVRKKLLTTFVSKEAMESDLESLLMSIERKEMQVRTSRKDRVYDTFNYFLNKFFSGKYLIDKDTFQIRFLGKCLGKKASRILSDGEKSIVAFCYYLASTHLLINKEDDYDDLFLIIDDPISSMDFNYVYVVAQILKEIKTYFKINTYDRIWVLTHNMEFLSIIVRNHIINQVFVMRPGRIEKIKRQYLMPYENHLRDVFEVATNNQPPSHTTANSIRHVLETIGRFEYPEKNLETYIFEQESLANNSCIYTLCQDLSHGTLRAQKPCSDDVIIGACRTLVDFIKLRYKGQAEAIGVEVKET